MLLSIYFASTVFVFGAIIGSFLNVVIYRLHTGRSINGHSHCMSCGHGLSWYELVPIVSYLGLRGRCRVCRSYIPLRYVVVELLTASAFLGLYFLTADYYLLALWALLAGVLIVTAVYDLYHLIIPNELPIVIGVVTSIILLYEAYPAITLTTALIALASAAVGYGFFGCLWLISQGRWLGLGDAKLALPLAIPLSLMETASMILLSFWIGAVVSVVLLYTPMVRTWCQKFFKQLRGRAYAPTPLAIPEKSFTMKSEIPFAPFLIAAFVCTYFLGVSAFGLIDYVLTLFI